ncbi:MAG: class I SAM-dependent methyltransferase [Desulfotomaculaceae bacterium]|nr:class I SAM-dependent methyltransferase [Desulfotomaculaceae bacterium]
MEINAVEFDKIAREVFAPVYPVIAGQIKHKTGIIRGTCLDIGCGGGYLGIAMTGITELDVYLFDASQEMLKIAAGNIASRGLEQRIQTLPGDVHKIPLDDNSIDLVISRGSVFFWRDRQKAFQEIHRVLKPGGVAFVGGGFGTEALKEQITSVMEKKNKNWREKLKKNIGENAVEGFAETLRKAGIITFEIDRNEAGLWIIIRREHF